MEVLVGTIVFIGVFNLYLYAVDFNEKNPDKRESIKTSIQYSESDTLNIEIKL